MARTQLRPFRSTVASLLLGFRRLFVRRLAQKPGNVPSVPTFLSRSAFNRFTASNRRLLRSTRSGVTCHPHTRRRRRRAFDLPPIPHSNPAPKATTSPLTVPESPHCRVGDQGADRQLLTPGIGHPQTARPRHTPARPEANCTAKRKTLRTPRQPERLTLPLTRSKIARPGRPKTRTAIALLSGRDRYAAPRLTSFQHRFPRSLFLRGAPL